jgi:hypothetical protein
VPAQKRKKLHNEVRSLLTTQYFLYAWNLPFFLVTCWQVSGEMKKKNGTESDVSIDNESLTFWAWLHGNVFNTSQQIKSTEINDTVRMTFISVKLLDFLFLTMMFILQQPSDEKSKELVDDVSAFSVTNTGFFGLFLTLYLIICSPIAYLWSG